MSRTVGGGLASHLATGRTKLSRCIRLDLSDGSSLGITDHDVDLSVNLGDGSLTYQAGVGAIPSALALAIGLDADSVEIRGPIGSVVTRGAVLGGRYTRARVRMFDVRWDSPTQFLRLLAGKVAEARVEAGQFVFEVRSATDAFNQTIGRVLSPLCSHDFGVGQCQATPQTWNATVASVTDDLIFTATFTGDTPTAELAQSGLCSFTSGVLLGLPPVEVVSLAAGVVSLFQPLAELPTVGDALTIIEGCAKTRDACKLKGQILNFGGFPDMVGTDQYIKVGIPGT